MSKTNMILEALFTGADEAECARRDKEAVPIMQKEWLDNFLKEKTPYLTKLPDDSYDVHGNVEMSKVPFTKFPLKFNKIEGSFYCDQCGLTTLENGPKIVEGSFWASYNKLTSLKGAPKEVRNYFVVNDNELTSLEGAPKFVGLVYSVFNNPGHFTNIDVRAYTDIAGEIRTERTRKGYTNEI